MTNKELKYLEDVLLAINDINEIVGKPRIFENFVNNKTIRFAVERNFEIIGEAIKNFKKLNNEIDIIYSKQIIGLRNIISHAYDAVDYPRVWSIIINHLPDLEKEVSALIKKFEH
ncbi:MAG: HepT-like ribonuclease domain-containing protein [Bacteroidia bacterium]